MSEMLNFVNLPVEGGGDVYVNLRNVSTIQSKGDVGTTICMSSDDVVFIALPLQTTITTMLRQMNIGQSIHNGFSNKGDSNE